MKPIPYRDVKRKLESAGFSIATQKGSHVKFLKTTSEGIRTVIGFDGVSGVVPVDGSREHSSSGPRANAWEN
jgi:predicted RNA binding protein YcfA (HicA-like mRNA interferase family)